MLNQKLIRILHFGFVLGLVGCQRSEPLAVDSINPMIGAVTYAAQTEDVHGFGKTFPGAATPFGLVQLSPDTLTEGDNGSGYSYTHHTIEGFSFTHMSGVGWYGDLGNFLVTPTVGSCRLIEVLLTRRMKAIARALIMRVRLPVRGIIRSHWRTTKWTWS